VILLDPVHLPESLFCLKEEEGFRAISIKDALLMMKFMHSYGIVMHQTMEDILAEIKQQQKSFKVVYIGQQSSKIRMHLLKL
ncbi:hypothetical protein PIB30_108885, partial [Stylosanthes scabra]|nr:hypothetical protein [Stylosanthes scabra]